MWKKISTMFSLLILLVFISNPTSWGYMSPVNFVFDPRYPRKMGNPISIFISSAIEGHAESVIDITIPAGVQVLKGNLLLRGLLDDDYTVSSETLMVQIDQPGIYEIKFELSASKLEKTNLYKELPIASSCFFYVREDTVVCFWNREEMERKIRDSLIVPQEMLNHRLAIQEEQNEFKERADKNLPPLTISNNIRYAAGCLGLITDSLEYYKRSGRYNSDLYNLIRFNDLMRGYPRMDKVEKKLAMDFHGSITSEQLSKMVETIKRQLMELYDYDQKIINLKPLDERNRLLKERKVLLVTQTKERQSIIKTQQPEKH